uniref:Ig-like domain-containing protein n=1 Tax=Heliothis virescens TaxID=7102 RepID=A0A2A4JY84_HELVI
MSEKKRDYPSGAEKRKRNKINITEGSDLYLSLPNAISFYETCKLYGPDNKPVTYSEVDTVKRESCGYIVRNVNVAHSGIWIIEYENEYAIMQTGVAVNVLEAVNMTLDSLSWDVGSSVDTIVGPANAVYCRVTDNRFHKVFEGFGPCRIVVDRVTMDYSGQWSVNVGVPGAVAMHHSSFYVNVGREGARPVVTTGVARDGQSVTLTCAVPAGYEVSACKFRDPMKNNMIATHGVGQDGYAGGMISYESNADNHVCTLRILNFVYWQSGTYRCAVNTSQGILHGFLRVTPSYIADYGDYSYSGPVLRSSDEYPYEGEAVTLSCSIDAPIRYCYFRSPNGTVYSVGPSILSSDYEYVGSGFSGGECGIRFYGALQSHDGLWTCHVGLENDIYADEKTSQFRVTLNERAWTSQTWERNTITVEMAVAGAYELDYCRFVRVDGLGFTWDNVPAGYRVDRDRMDSCVLYVERPTALDCQPWTVVAKRYGYSGELARTTDTQRLTSFVVNSKTATGFFLWVFFAVSVVMMILAGICLIQFLIRKHEWSYARAARIRNSFRRQPSPAQQNLAAQPNHSVTDLPYKVPDSLIWDVGSSVDMIIGPEDAGYCSVRDSRHRLVVNGLGPCRIVVDRVTIYHNGLWSASIGVADSDVIHNSRFYVQVTGAVPQGHIDVFAREGDQVTMSCSPGMPIRYCYVIASNGTVFNASRYTSITITALRVRRSGFDAGDCSIRFNNIRRSDEGRFSCHAGLANENSAEERWTYVFVYVDARTPRYVWLTIGIPCMLLIIAAITLISKSNHNWASVRAAHIRNSFRRGAPQQRQIHPPTHIITHLTLKA